MSFHLHRREAGLARELVHPLAGHAKHLRDLGDPDEVMDARSRRRETDVQVASEEIVSTAAANGAPPDQALPVRKEGPDLAALIRRPSWMRVRCAGRTRTSASWATRGRQCRVCSRCLAQEECRAYGLENELVDSENTGGRRNLGRLTATDRVRLRQGTR